MPSCHLAAILSARTISPLFGTSLARNAAPSFITTGTRGQRYRKLPSPSPRDPLFPRHSFSPRYPLQDRNSRRTLKKKSLSPSHYLVDALETLGKRRVLPYSELHRLKHKADLSYRSWKSPWARYGKKGFRHASLREPQQKLSLQKILSSYITENLSRQHANATNEFDSIKSPRGIPIEYSEEAARFLHRRRYDQNDVHVWASILCAEDVNGAARQLLLHSCASIEAAEVGWKPLPAFVPLFFARRSDLNPAALRCLLIYAWEEIRWRQSRRLFETDQQSHRESAYPKHIGYHPMNDSTMFILILRLLRCARAKWSAALVTITSMFNECFGPLETPRYSRKALRRKCSALTTTSLYNKMLALLAIPSISTPFHAVAYHQRAQFDLLQIMASHARPLTITRAGYRAIVTVQLANKKTAQERDWDNLKAKSWPPWKQERTGLDAEKGVVYGTSRALEVLVRSQEAGYGAPSWNQKEWVWDKVATILSGWDVDGSPTIQTRALLAHQFVSHKDMSKHTKSRQWLTATHTLSDKATIWASRIQVTRTVHEAWACFLAYSDRNFVLEKEVYLAMLEKLAFEAKRLRSVQYETVVREGDNHDLNAGDRKEVNSPPLSPKEATYVRIQPPSFHDLAIEMNQNKIRLQGLGAELMLNHAETLEHGLQYVEWIKKATPSVESLLVPRPEYDSRLTEVPVTLFGAFIGLLCRFPQGDRLPTESLSKNQSYPTNSLGCRSINGYDPVQYALHLLTARLPMHHLPWHHVLRVLTAGRKPQDQHAGNDFEHNRAGRVLQRWNNAQDLVSKMSDIGLPMDYETLLLTCKGLESAALAAMHVTSHLVPLNSTSSREIPTHDAIKATIPEADEELHLVTQANEVLNTSSQYIRIAFHKVFGTGKHIRASQNLMLPESSALPRLLAVPRSATIHAYARALGTLRDWQGVVDMVRWMVKYEREITEGVDMPKNGPRILRKTLVAVRVYLEATWIDHDAMDRIMLDKIAETMKSKHAAPQRTVDTARRLVDSVEAWGGWASDAEIEAYCTVPTARFPSVQDLLRQST